MSETPPIPIPPDPRPRNARFASWLAGLSAQGRSLRSRTSSGEPVRLLHPDGSQSVWRGSVRLDEENAAKKPKFVAIQVPDDLVLMRSMLLPRLSDSHGAEAVQLEARSNSPFPPDDLAWGWLGRDIDGGQKQVDLALASRRHIATFLQERWPELASAPKQPEAWALSAQGLPIVLQGYGEVHRLHDASIERRWNWALAAVVLALATTAAITPTIQLRLRALEAGDAFEAVLRRVAPMVRKRDELATLNDKARALDTIAAERVDPAGVMEYLTQVLPDDTYLYSLDVQRAKITASGHTVDASLLLQKLSLDPRLKNVKAPMAVTRLPGATKEAFVIEFTMGPKPVPANSAAAAPVAVPSATVAIPAATGATIVVVAPVAAVAAASASAAPKPPAPAKPAPGSSPFVIGGSR